MKCCPACAREFEGQDWNCPACRWRPEVVEGIPLLGGGPPREGHGFSVTFYASLAEREAQYFWFRARNRLLQWAFARYTGHSGSYLEIGCGTGFVLQGIAESHPQWSLTGAELFIEGLSYAARRVAKATFLQLDARHMPFREEFDAIGLFDVLEHIEEDQQVLEAVSLACKPGGTVLITVPQHPWLWTVIDERSFHVRRYSREDLLRKMRWAGLEPIRVGSFVSLLLPVLALSRLHTQRNKKSFDPLAEFDLPPWEQTILLSVLDFERTLIRIGVDFPMGGSLFVVAKRV